MSLDFKWRPGSRVKGDPTRIGCEILRLTKEKGRSLSTEEFVEEAKKPESPLHDCISTWDTQEAAEKWWRHEARQIMAQIEIVDSDSGVRIPLLLNIEVSEYGHRYVETSLIAEREDLQEQVLKDAKRGLQAWQDRYERLHIVRESLAEVFDAISKACGFEPEKLPPKRRTKKRENNLPAL
jgi:hypothetical protein